VALRPHAGALALAAARALGPALERARRQIADPGALTALAAACASARDGGPEDARRVELERSAAALAAFLDPRLAAPPAPAPPERVPAQLRTRAALPLATGPTAQLLALLAPWLEPLFPADRARRGAGPGQRLGPQRAPALEARLAAAGRAFGSRPAVGFLADGGGCDIWIENTQPPSLVLGAQLPRELRPSAVDFALARALCHADLGGALAGRFSPRDVGVLCELACRFAGGAPPHLGLPPERARAFIDALERIVPPTVHQRAAALSADTAAELRGLPARELQLALRRTASRQALLRTGDPLGALEALGAARRGPGRPDPLADRVRALGEPDLADLAGVALSELYLELRLATEARP
jgi:hypothetical protein